MSTHHIEMSLNGLRCAGEVEARVSLADFLRDDAGYTGVHLGCEHGVCGACTVQVDGLAVRSCLYLAVQLDGRRIDTIEGLANADGSFGILQQAFHENFALQCGFCTPGFLTTLNHYLQKNANPTEVELREALSGNMCRCTGYAEIIRAALIAAERLRERTSRNAK